MGGTGTALAQRGKQKTQRVRARTRERGSERERRETKKKNGGKTRWQHQIRRPSRSMKLQRSKVEEHHEGTWRILLSIPDVGIKIRDKYNVDRKLLPKHVE